jgi:hypothetical protein
MTDITIITPPDLLLNDAYSILLIHPSHTLKAQIQDILQDSYTPINVFLYEGIDESLVWLLQLVKTVDVCILDVDNCDPLTRAFASHIIAQPSTFYLTNDGVTPYNIISKNRVFDLNWLQHILRGNDEQAPTI